MERRAVVNRKTRETDIALELNLDGSGKYEIDTGIGFFRPYAFRLCKTRLF